MVMSRLLEWTDDRFLHEVEHRSGTPVSTCLQCHKCSSGCPVGSDMDLLPSQIMRLIHLGVEDEILQSAAIWTCASCEACTTRCPMGIDVASVMDALRMRAVERKAVLGDPRAACFNKALLASVHRHGRVFELGMMARYKLASHDLRADMNKIPKMLAKRKLSFLPHFSSSVHEVRKVFRRAVEEENKR